MSFGTSPSTMTVDPTPPQLRPLQNQLVQMLMGRMSGQGRTSVPTYGSALGNVQQQLYGIDPRSASRQVGGFGPPPTRTPTGPRYGSGGGNMPTFGETQRPPMVDAGPMLGQPPASPGGMTAVAPPIMMAPGEYNGPQGYYNASGQWQSTGGPPMGAPPPIGDPVPMNLQPMDLTRGGPTGSMQGASSPWNMPTFGSVMNGSGLIRANSNPYGYRYY
jgi:hypothetical protein